ncbi:hypothetical protein F2Q69_00021734 [Brassica cretica]|uniref:Uncharacterized protein n=1 Tax=Brassica cretica TaxID=69181 RepID=A0A8S9QH23_BRACR|nr:hypothetical protein F2Q69_00021734 [Brassica cretica]
MIDNPRRVKDDAGTVIWLFLGSELNMRGDRFSIFREFRSVCKIWLNSDGTTYRDRKNCLRLMCKLAGFLKTLEYWPRDKFWDLVSGCLILCLEMLETSVLGLGQDLGLIMTLGGAMTTSTYVSRIVFDLIPSLFKVRDMFSAYVTCMVGIEHPFEDNF